MSEDKHLEEKEKLEAEISRSLSVAKMKEAHKQIEDIEKSRKQAFILSIYRRISFCRDMSNSVVTSLLNTKAMFQNRELNWELKESDGTRKSFNKIIEMYESICFDFQRTIDIKKEDFDKLFPKIEFDFTTYESIIPIFSCLSMQLIDMQNYCIRLL